MNFSSLGLENNGYDKSKPIVTNCNVGLTAAFLSYAIEDAVKNIPRLYNVRMFFLNLSIKTYLLQGSLKELELRAPKTISGGNTHLPH